MAARHVVVDGSNIATEGRSLPSLKQLDEAVRAFIKENPDDVLTIVVDATFEHRIDSSEKKMYDEALEANELITPPAGTIGRGDKFLLEIADRADATVLSNDSFQEFHGEYSWLFDEDRLVGGKPVPGIGWIFTGRTPVRGPKSRQAVRAAGKKRSRAETSSSGKKQTASSPGRSGSGRSGRSPRPGSDRGGREAERPTESDDAQNGGRGGSRGRGRRGATPSTDPINDPLPFVEFIAEHPVGSRVEGEVVEFSSHGAYVLVGAARCYVPLKSMGDPAPRSAREVLEKGEIREFVVQSLDAPRRGIDLAFPGFEVIEVPVDADEGESAVTGEQLIDDPADAVAREVAARRAATSKKPGARKAAGRKRVGAEPPVTAAGPEGDEAQAAAGEVPAGPVAEAVEAASTAVQGAEVVTERAPAKKAATKKATTKKAATKKAAVKKAATKKAATKKAAVKKAATKKAATKQAATEEPVVKKAAAKKATTKKATTKKAAAKKAAVKKAAAKKATARKAASKKAAPPAG
jgi:hypothetical protein